MFRTFAFGMASSVVGRSDAELQTFSGGQLLAQDERGAARRGWAANLIPAATSDFSSSAVSYASGRFHGSAASVAFWLFGARLPEANLRPEREGRARQSLQAKDLGAGGSVTWPDPPFAPVVFGNSLELPGPQFPSLAQRMMMGKRGGGS